MILKFVLIKTVKITQFVLTSVCIKKNGQDFSKRLFFFYLFKRWHNKITRKQRDLDLHTISKLSYEIKNAKSANSLIALVPRLKSTKQKRWILRQGLLKKTITEKCTLQCFDVIILAVNVCLNVCIQSTPGMFIDLYTTVFHARMSENRISFFYCETNNQDNCFYQTNSNINKSTTNDKFNVYLIS